MLCCLAGQLKEPYTFEDLEERLVRTPLYGSPSNTITSYTYNSRLHLSNASRLMPPSRHACMMLLLARRSLGRQQGCM